jgi:hypothetical protein
MKFSGTSTKHQCKSLKELIRILELRIDAKQLEVDQCREVKRLRDEELTEQKNLRYAADNALKACTASIAAARTAAFVPDVMHGFVASQRNLLKLAKIRHEEVEIAIERVVEAGLLLDQTLEALGWLRSRQQILENLLQTLLKHIAVLHNLLEDTLQDDDYSSYLSSKKHAKRWPVIISTQ